MFTPGAAGAHTDVMIPNAVEKIQFTNENHTETGFTTRSDRGIDEDEHPRKRFRVNSFSDPSTDVFVLAHESKLPSSKSTAEKKTAEASGSADNYVDQEAQFTNPSQGSRIPKRLLTTLLSQQFTSKLVVLELPPEMDSDHMNMSYNMVSVPVPASLSFKNRYATLLRHFVEIQSRLQEKTEPTIMVLSPVENCTGKMITLVEKLKRDLGSRSVRCFQYCAVQSRLIMVDRTKGAKRNSKGKNTSRNEEAETVMANAAISLDENGSHENAEEEEEAFQTMDETKGNPSKMGTCGNMKQRRFPVMTIFLALTPVPELRQLYRSDPFAAVVPWQALI